MGNRFCGSCSGRGESVRRRIEFGTKNGQPRAARFDEELLQERYDSRASCIWGYWSLAFARDFTTSPSAFSDVRLRAVSISLTRRYLARSNIFFSRKERGLLRLRETRLLRTTATSRREPVRMRSEFSLKRCFQSWCEFSLPFSRKPSTLLASLERITARKPTDSAFDCGTITRKPLETIRIMKYRSVRPFKTP